MESKERSYVEFLKVLSFLAASARGCVDEPPLYGPFRLVDAISRLIDFVLREKVLPESEFLVDIRKFVDENKFKVMLSEEEFVKFLDELVRRFARELREKA